MPHRPAALALAAGRVNRTMATAAVLLLCGLTVMVAFLNKARCAGTPFFPDGRSTRFDLVKDSSVCYSDIQFLWIGRDIDRHVFPYIHGGITPDGALVGGAVEYPVLSGLLMWLGALRADNDAQFLWYSALLLAPFALLIAWMLVRLAGRAALLWAAGPPLVLYAFHNWELPVVCTMVGAVYVMVMLPRLSLRTRAMQAAALLGVGFCLKLYPAIFVLPLMLYVFTGGDESRRADLDESRAKAAVRPAARTATSSAISNRRFDIRGTLATGAVAVGTVLLVNLPFAVGGYDGWRASIEFQRQRQADITTNSIWYWGLRQVFGVDAVGSWPVQSTVSIVSPILVLAAFATALGLGWSRYTESGVYPWLGVSGAMLCGFLLFHKVHSPQYTLWLLPFVILLEVPWSVIGSYLVADIAIGVGVFRYFHALGTGHSVEVMEAVVRFGVWGRATLLVVLFFVFLRAPLRRRPLRDHVPRRLAEPVPTG
ncbi:hypothetical protein [Nocardia paucivorans]|uniref:hypothetical protein n=1 Tax=Nocardia paucivorans TaxID=114259 RepID=UPI000A0773FC|nr:hypothetical protein [Nocardia paucivorans]